MTDTPMPTVTDLTLQTAKLVGLSTSAIATAAERLGMNPLDLAERLQDGGIAEIHESLRLATNELNIIRARDGAPQHIDWHRGQPLQTDGCTKEWWDELTERCFATLKRVKP